MTDMQMDLFAARQARDVGMKRVEANAGDWGGQARSAFLKAVSLGAFPAGWEGTGEDIRVELTKRGLHRPHHHNAWGPFTVSLRKRGWIIPTGEWRQMKTEKSHARPSAVYRRRSA